MYVQAHDDDDDDVERKKKCEKFFNTYFTPNARQSISIYDKEHL